MQIVELASSAIMAASAVAAGVGETFLHAGLPARFVFGAARRARWQREDREDQHDEGERVGVKGGRQCRVGQ
jgi:hypothetical protein